MRLSLEDPLTYEDPYGNYMNLSSNATSRAASAINRDQYDRDWNREVTAVERVLKPYFKHHVFKKLPMKDPPEIFTRYIYLVFAKQLILLLFYGDSVPQVVEHTKLLIDGYCPCGYIGEFPSGRLIVY